VSVDKGRFSLTLGADSTGALESVVSANPALYAQFVMQLGSGPAEVLVPRLPMTQSMLSGLPSVLQGAADPTATAPRGTYFRNTASGSTWIRMTSNWVLIAD
jgi:hypothetical protein